MRILYVLPKYYPNIGGSGIHVKNLAERLAKKHDVSIFVPTRLHGLARHEEVEGVEVRRFWCLAPHDAYYFSPPIGDAVFRSDADIVHMHGYYDLLPAIVILSKNSFEKCLFTLHSGGAFSRVSEMLHWPYNIGMGTIIKRRVNKVIYVSKSEQRHFQNLWQLPQSRIELIPNGVNVSRLYQSSYKRADPPIILSAARLEKYKGHHVVIEAFRLFKKAHPESKAKLVILGRGTYEDQLREQVHVSGVSDAVSFLGWLPDGEYYDLMKSCAMFLLLSDHEAHPIAVAEAIAAMKPVIVTIRPGLDDFVGEGNAVGIPYPPSAIKVAEIIQEVLRDPGSYIPRNRRILSWDDVAARVEELYKRSLQN